MRILFVTDYYSEGMGYIENGLTKAIAALGHDVHVVTSNLNIQGNLPSYQETYGRFLGPAECECGVFQIDGYTVHRLPHSLLGGYVRIRGLVRTVSRLRPDIVQVSTAAGLNTFALALSRGRTTGPLFSACHQCSSVLSPCLKRGFLSPKRFVYRLTRTWPGWLTSLVTTRCYAVTPDCAEVAQRYYGIPARKIAVVPIGTDTILFRPPVPDEDDASAREVRSKLGFEESDIACIYTGRMSSGKNPLLLAKAIGHLRAASGSYVGLFVGEGAQADEIRSMPGCIVRPFARHRELAEYYRSADIGVWPFQESMSMLDAAASGLPVVANDCLGERERVDGNGLFYRQGDLGDLVRTLQELRSPEVRRILGEAGVAKMNKRYSWTWIAEQRIRDYTEAIRPQRDHRTSSAAARPHWLHKACDAQRCRHAQESPDD